MDDAGIYLVTEKLDLANHEQVDALERALGVRMPRGYRSLVTTFGRGEFCSILSIHGPDEILRGLGFLRFTFEHYHFWDEFPDGVSEQDLLDSVVIASTSNGDYFSIRIDRPQNILFVPRHDSKIKAIDAMRTELIDLYWSAEDELPPGFRYFDSSMNRASFEVTSPSPQLHREDLIESLINRFGSLEHHRVDTVLETAHIVHIYLRALQGYVYIDGQSAEEGYHVGRVLFMYDRALEQQAQVIRQELIGLGSR